MNRFLKSPWLEVNIMLAVLILSYIGLALISWGAETPPGGMSGGAIWGWLLGFFVLTQLSTLDFDSDHTALR